MMTSPTDQGYKWKTDDDLSDNQDVNEKLFKQQMLLNLGNFETAI